MVTPDGIVRRHRVLATALIIIAVAALLTLYGLVDPASGLYPRCAFKLVTGLDCPGCGSQRAIHALLHGDIASAWRSNAMLIFGLPTVALLLVARAIRHRHPMLERTLNSQGIILALLAATVLWTIVRNIH
ncbi:MAG: DUF2752 domain-containing protein [Duncaniella sp.]|nr:DUF2752 domain-containing protein [Duncaniella sp.]